MMRAREITPAIESEAAEMFGAKTVTYCLQSVAKGAGDLTRRVDATRELFERHGERKYCRCIDFLFYGIE